MSRAITLEEAFLFEGFELNGNQIKPLSCNRRTFLRRVGNEIFGGEDDSNRDDGEQFAEALLACTKSPPELGSYLARVKEWREEVVSFAVSLDDHVVERFQAIIAREIEALQAAKVEPLGKDTAQ
jgi:hypothetical protein